ncbi:MAG: DUF4286 family protein, partial [Planctomycetota bacterium]|nr:DUF4286 family protein [Planctomycetota bacterium]
MSESAQFRYTVRATFACPSVAAEWLQWLLGGHIDEVLAGGANHAEIVKIDYPSPGCCYEIRYAFQSRTAYEGYEQDHAPRLRAEGVARFPVTRGIQYERSIGTVVT